MQEVVENRDFQNVLEILLETSMSRATKQNRTLLITTHLRPHAGGVREKHAIHAQYQYRT